ncbi:cyclic nucleotide-binding domain-containing protein [Halomonas sp. NO4]|uniref:cyclic nucleotide-binding domain-containing protein n=1 Tax=Halomonas sp. NO4 TaxID=2484813 RepID=UPI0013D865EB|nr:cyclic nucleotide-binding domain-containing protein [Halomonas sp. NO4]
MLDYPEGLIHDVLGMTGVALFIGAYAGLQLGFLRGNNYPYTLINLLGATLVLTSLSQNFNLSSVINQVLWILISLAGLARLLILRYLVRLNDEEQAFIQAKFPGMTAPMARRLLKAGRWESAEAGTTLATQGERIGALIYLSQGHAEVWSGGRLVGHCRPPSFIGEMTCFSGEAATATVTLAEPSRYFIITTEALLRLCRRDPELRMMLDNTLYLDTRMKLVAANERLQSGV